MKGDLSVKKEQSRIIEKEIKEISKGIRLFRI